MTLEKGTRDAIGRTVRILRELFEEEFGKQATGRFGIRSSRRTKATEVDGLDAWLDPLESLSLTPAEFAQRDELVHALHYLISEGNEPSEAVARLIREAAFTAVNRLLAVRVAEAIGILPAVLSAGRQSAGFKEAVGDLFPALAGDENAYWTYLQIAGDELATGVPRLFDRRYPTSAFVPSRACVDEALQLLTADEFASAWIEPETLGWGYQFFNGDDVKQMREASPAPRNSRELAVRNQFFTPRYVVDWLVQNTLGRRLVQAGYDVDLPLLVGEVDDREPLDLVDVRVLDPAVGSGHFLLGSYDLLEQAWQSIGIAPSECAAKILPCLFGVDIDPRAAQVAQAVLLLRARRSAPDADLTPPPIVTAVALPHNAQLREEVFGSLSPAAQVAARDIAEALDQAPLLGSLLKVEQRLEAELTAFGTAPRLTDGDANTVLADLERALGDLVSSASSPEERMFAAEAADAVGFIAICRGRYDTVLMNPPFGEPIAASKEYLRSAYGSAWSDLFAAFVSRGIELAKPVGLVGAITTRSGFFLTTFAEWRSELVLPRLVGMLDLGIGVMHDAMVRAATYVLGPPAPRRRATFARYLDDKDKEKAVYGAEPSRAFTRVPEAFRAIPQAPAAYWLPEELLNVFASHGPLESETATIRVGLQTSDNFRFVRLWWEVDPGTIGPGERWRSFATGGAFAPYYADLHTVVDWEDNGRRIREFHTRELGYSETRLVRSADHYFRPGLTWNRRSEGFFVSLVPPGAVFSNNGQMIFVRDDDESLLFELMAYLNSASVGSLIEPMVGAEQYEVGMVQRLPLARPGTSAGRMARELWDRLRLRGAASEVDHHFVMPRADVSDNRELIELSSEVDRVVSATLDDGGACPSSSTTPTQWLSRQRPHTRLPDSSTQLSYVLGLALGRWDARFSTGDADAPPPIGPLDPLPPVSPGMLVGPTGLPAREIPPHYPISVPPDRLLLDDPGHEHDVVAAIERLADILEAGSRVPDLALAQMPDLRNHLRTRFFGEHLRQYSASRRYAPIYWQLAVASKRWGLWLYAPSLSRESLFAIARASRERLSLLGEQVRLARARSAADRSAREHAESLEELTSEVERFAVVADEVAQSGWEPDLNDGFVLNAAPMEELFVDKTWRGQIAKHRKAMQRGDYPWATVQREYFEKRR